MKKKCVVDNISLKVKKGEIYGFLGPNGAGKTTTIKMLLGLAAPTKGNISIFGKELRKSSMEILAQIGSLVESPTYYGNLTGYENLQVIQRILNVPKKRINEVLNIVKLSKSKHQLAKKYSLGMKQRLGIAMALLGNPKLLILDEPTNGLDPAGIHDIRELIKSLPSAYGMTVMISSHLLSEIDQMATQVGVINGGKFIFQGSIDKLRQKSNASIVFNVNEPEKAMGILEKKGLQVKTEPGIIKISPQKDEIIAKVNELLVNNNISVYRIEERIKTLEDIFLQLIDKGGDI